MMNEFDNNMNNMQSNENETVAPTEENSTPVANQNTNPTYQSTYTPTADGYTSSTAGMGSYRCAPDGTYTRAPGAAPYYVPQNKKSGMSKGAVISIAVCAFLAVSVIFMFVGMSIADWVNDGGLYVHINIRGGNEYGTKWHEEGMLKNKKNCYVKGGNLNLTLRKVAKGDTLYDHRYSRSLLQASRSLRRGFLRSRGAYRLLRQRRHRQGRASARSKLGNLFPPVKRRDP